MCFFFFFFNDTATTEIYTTTDTLSLHDALPILTGLAGLAPWNRGTILEALRMPGDRKSTRLKLQSPVVISYAVFCLKKKKKTTRNFVLVIFHNKKKKKKTTNEK